MLIAMGALVIGLALLTVAADQFVLGAARVALIRRLSPVLVGMVIIGFGTSLPELLVSVIATVNGSPEIAVGNILGSNIANLSLLLGVGAVMIPIVVNSQVVRREVPITVTAMIVLALFLQGGLNRVEGAVLVSSMAVVLWWLSRHPGGDSDLNPPLDPLGPEAETFAADHDAPGSLGRESARTALGLIGTVAGAQLLLWGATNLADRAGLAPGFVGATLVAIGTSLPELVTVAQSARRGETDLIVGNLLGSNLFNALGVGGAIGLVGTEPLDDRSLTLVAAGAAILIAGSAGIAMGTGWRVVRWEGVALIVCYVIVVFLLR